MVAIRVARTPSGRRIEVSRTVDAPPAVAWDLTADTRHWPAWGPPVTAVDPADNELEAGLTGRVRALGLARVPFRIQTCEGHSWTWTVFGHTPPAAGHRVEPAGPERSRIVLELPLWAPWYVPMCVWALAKLGRLAKDQSERGPG
jgi:hypothetical protein